MIIMPYDLSNYLVIAISSRALFDLTVENEIFENEGLEAYCKYQLEKEDKLLKPGAGFPIVQSILRLNQLSKRKAEVVIMSRNNADTSLRIFKSAEAYKLDITRAVFTSGRSIVPYLKPFKVDLFLSASEDDVQDAINQNIAAGLIYNSESNYETEIEELRIAFDGDAVLFSAESEKIYLTKGLEFFLRHEKKYAKKALREGPFAKLLRTISFLQHEADLDNTPIRTALVTARNSPAHERVIRTLREWNVRVDEAFFLGGVSKAEVLQAFGAHIFFDDQDTHLAPASKFVPVAKVPIKRILKKQPIQIRKKAILEVNQ
jgi:5'-nucleotidase